MADSYIDQFETVVYGRFAREQMQAVCLGMIKELDGMVKYAVAAQRDADELMAGVLERQPRAVAPVDVNAAQEEARDVIVRFGSYLDSLKGRPVDPKLFFQGDAPSVLGKRRLTKLSAGVTHVREELERHRERVRDWKLWHGELTEVEAKLKAAEKQQRSAKVDRAMLAPEVAAQREVWLAVYGANKHLIRGLLAHVGKPELLPLIFDDLAEVHRAAGVSDDPAPAATGA